MKFYEYHQNNSGGVDVETAWVNKLVIVEAATAEDANAKALTLGLYFNGCQDGRDCSCCGDRWDEASSWDESDVPSHYGKPVDLAEVKDYNTIIYYANGDVKRVHNGSKW